MALAEMVMANDVRGARFLRPGRHDPADLRGGDERAAIRAVTGDEVVTVASCTGRTSQGSRNLRRIARTR
jgi:hypothetical protein